jgi:predicted aconitase
MELTKEEKLMLEGDEGEGVQKAMEILVALAEIYGADGMVEIESAQIAGVSYKNLGDAGLEFLEGWADKGARVRVPATLNPAGMDLKNWKILGIPRDFAEKQLMVVKAYERMGVKPACTCTPYLVGNLPSFGGHIAWSESSAVSYANSVIGARTNREGGPSALAAAIAGRTPMYGYHLNESRLASFLIDVRCELKTISDYGALGYLVGKKIGNSVPFFRGIKKADSDQLKSLGAAMAASGAVALFHVEGITPEAKMRNVLAENAETISLESIDKAYEELNSETKEIDLVTIGCPHASLAEIRRMASLLKGKKIKTELWITTSLEVKGMAGRKGLLKDIEESGAKVVSDTCMIVAPIQDLGFRSIATNSGKGAFYAPSHCGVNVRFGSLNKCIEAALIGRWQDGA